jgi:hypothetical protein
MTNKGELLASILNNFRDCYFFLHNTKEINVVESIINEGFIFESQLPRSTDRVNPNEPIEITYFLFQRKDYGTFTIIIAIPKSTYELYSDLSVRYDVGIEEVLTITDPHFGENDELIYTVPREHVLGYFNIKTVEFFRNTNWDPLYKNNKFVPSGKKPVKSVKKL